MTNDIMGNDEYGCVNQFQPTAHLRIDTVCAYGPQKMKNNEQVSQPI